MTGSGSPEPEVAPDPLVATALQLLPVPSHDDGFWAGLEAALDAEEPHVAPAEPGRRVLVATVSGAAVAPEAVPLEADRSLALVPPAFRRPSNVVLAAVAAAALVVVGVSWSSLQERGGTQVTAGSSAADPALETLVRQAQGDDATVPTVPEAGAEASTDAVLEWVDSLGRGDAGAAWAAMGEASQAHFGGQDAFESLMSDLAEGYGAWSAAEPDDVVVTPVASGDDATIAVVTLIGPVEQEGTTEVRAEAFPVRIVDGDVVLEPFASAGELEVVIPEPETADAGGVEPVGRSDELVFVLPVDADAPVLQVDGGDTVVCGEADGSDLHDLEQASGQRCAYLPEGGFEPGEHTVTIAFVGPDGGSVTAETIRFEAA